MESLSPEALAALREFYQEQAQRETRQKSDIDDFGENWQLSQFWLVSVDTGIL
jgi:hypothetical protein